MATHSSVLAWRILGTGSLVGCHLWGHTESDMTEATQQQQQYMFRKNVQFMFKYDHSGSDQNSNLQKKVRDNRGPDHVAAFRMEKSRTYYSGNLPNPLSLVYNQHPVPWRREWQPTPLFLPGKSHGRRSLASYSPGGRKEWDMTEQFHFHFFKHSCRKQAEGMKRKV